MRAVSFDFDAAALMGVPGRSRGLVHVRARLGAGGGGRVSCTRSSIPGLNQPAHATWVLLGLKAFVAAVIGGIGNVRGAVLGGFVIAFVEQFGAFYLVVELPRRVRVRAADCDSAGSAVRAARFDRAGKSVSRADAKPTSHRARIVGRRRRCAASSERVFEQRLADRASASRSRPSMHFTLPKAIGPYYTKIVIDIGIAIILAVSLNIVNGMTGQFSLGHAAFMALGGYAAGMVTYYGSMLMWDCAGEARRVSRARASGCSSPRASSAGSSRRSPVTSSVCRRCGLRGDYLAIVTLGFGEILRVILQQTEPVIDNAAAAA